MQTMLDRLRELSDDAVTARERADDLKQRAKDAKEFLDGVLQQLQHVAYKLSHGLQDLPFDVAPPEPLAGESFHITVGEQPGDAPLPESSPDTPEGDLERVRLFRRLVDEFLIPVQFRSVCRWTGDEVGEVLAWMDGGPVRPVFLPEARIPSVAEASSPAEPEPEPELELPAPVVPNRRARKVKGVTFAEDAENETPHPA